MLGALTLAPCIRAPRAAGNVAITAFAPGFALLTGAGGNVLVHDTPEGRVLVDSGNASSTDALLATLDEIPGERAVHTLLNTHWHLDQVGGNAALARAGAEIIAHDKTLRRLEAGYYLPDQDRYQPPLAREGLPTRAFYTNGATTVGDEDIEYGYLIEAHTDGDSYVYFRDANVLAVGDVVSPSSDPELDWFGGGWIGGRVDSLQLLLDISDADTRFVPSRGPVVGRGEVEVEHQVMSTLFERLVETIRLGMSPEDSYEAGVLDGLARGFDAPLDFLYAAHKSLWGHHNKLMPDIV
jgi:glyoxylase-like metal-dependent hydrolase (beta-lactamase superfamily II)